MKNRETYVVYIFCCAVPGYSSENRPRNSKFEYAQAWGIRPLQDQTCFRIAWRFRTNINCVREVSTIIFLDTLKTDSVGHAGEVLTQNAQDRRLSVPQTKGNV